MNARSTDTYTPGPWSITNPNYGPLMAEIGTDSRPVGIVWTRQMCSRKESDRSIAEPNAEGEANARLIAAAPELLAALKLAYPLLTDKAAREEIGALLNRIGQ